MPSRDSVFVLGGAQTDFARTLTKEGSDPFPSLFAEVVDACLRNARVNPGEVQTAHVANFDSGHFTGQAHLSAMIPMLDPAWSGLPTSRHEAACASGSAAVLGAMADIEAGRYDVALVVGAEVMRSVPGEEAARHIGCATWVGHEAEGDGLPWPTLFEEIAEETERRHGLEWAHLTRIAEINRTNARRNPLAQTRSWTYGPEQFADDDTTNPLVAGRMRKSDCGRISDGAAAVVLAGRRFAEEWSLRRPAAVPRPAAIRGWGHHSAPLPLAAKFELSKDEPYMFPGVRAAITEAYQRAGIPGAGSLDVIETHDCFTITEYIALEHFGVAEPGRAWRAVEDGRIAFGGSIPVNPSGGLIGAGHPVGATGIRMLLDVQRQVTGTAGDYQVPGATTAATLNIGGSCSTAVSFVVAGTPG